jgi:hypothetical protein
VTTYTRQQVLELVGIDAGFLIALEREDIVRYDAPEQDLYTERMLERARVARELVDELEVNLAGASIILRMREEISVMRQELSNLSAELRRLRGRG